MKSRIVGAAVVTFLALASSVVSTQAHAAPTATGHARYKAATPITPNGAWTVYHRDNAHTGFDSTQPSTTTASTGWTSPTLDESVYGEPLVYQGVVYVGTLNNTVYALNQTDGSVIWSKNLGAPTTGGWICGNFSTQGIVGTPVIDTAANRIYVSALLSSHVYWVFGLDLANLGNVVLQTPLTSTGNAGFASFDWTIQQERGALAVANGYVYVPFGGRAGDCYHNGVPYHGWVAGVPTNGSTAFNLYQTGGVENGIWSAGGVVVDDSTGKVFVTTGNGGCPTTYNYNDAVIRLSATLALEDYFAPQDWKNNWSCNDEDLGSASTVLINPNLAWQGGKWGNGFLVNPKNLGGIDGQLFPTPKPQTYTPADVCLGNHHDANFGSYAYAAPYVYVSCDANSQIAFTGRLVALKVDSAANTFSPCDSTCAAPSWAAGSTTFGPPIVAGGAVWVVDTGGSGLYAFDAATGAQLFHSGGFGATHFTTPSEAGGQIFVASDNTVREFNMLGGCRTVTASTNPPSTASVGTSVVITASASGCPNPLYQFWVLAPGASAYQLGQAYSPTATFSWSTTGLAPGNYQLSIWARDNASNGIYGNQFGRWDAYDDSQAENLVAPTCTGALNASISPPSPAGAGTAVTVTAQATGCPDPNPVYQFWVLPPGGNAYQVLQAYSPSGTLHWSTTGLAAGNYQLSIWARDANGTGAYGNQFGRWDTYNNSLVYTLTGPACAGLNANAVPSSSAGVGTPVTVSAQALGCPDPNPVYQFWVLPPGGNAYQLLQAYSTTSTFHWSTTGLTPGTYQFSIWARDASSSGTDGNQFGRWDTYNNNIAYTLTTCSSLAASAAPGSPAGVGRPVTITAQAMGCPNANPTYQFWILPPGGNAYQLAQAYSTSGTLNWSTVGLTPGRYQISIWARDASSGGADGNQFGRWDTYNNNIVYTLTTCGSLQVSAVSPPSPSARGMTVTVTVNASGCPNPNPVYQFWLLAPGAGAYQMVQAYSTSNTFTWNTTTGLAAGSYLFSVWVRDADSAGAQGNQFGTWDAYAETTYQLT